MKINVLIITALELEFKAVLAFTENRKRVVHPSTGTIYELGNVVFGKDSSSVAIVEAGAGNTRTTDECTRAIEFFKPEFVFFVGIAGGIKDVKIGDVVASSKIIGYETSKAAEEMLPRFDTIPSSYKLEQLAKATSRDEKWNSSLVKTGIKPSSFVGPIAAGEKVISSTKSITYSFLRKNCSDALAVEMEGLGFLQSIRSAFNHGIVIRGISDLIDKKEASDQEGSQIMAANNAASFAIEMISNLPGSSTNIKFSSEDAKLKLVDLMTSLYEQGPETENIWKRAGGNVAILINSASRKSQWYDAIDKLIKGGGGKSITLQSLLEKVREDFPERESDLEFFYKVEKK